MRLLTLRLLCALTLSLPIGAATRQDVAREIDATLGAAEAKGFSGVILIRDSEGDVLLKAYGPGSCDGKARLTPKYRFDIGSITKVFTAAAILRARIDGALALTDTLASTFTDVPADKREITVMHLLTHTSGLPESIGDDETLIRRDFFLRRAFAAPLLSRPGERTSYSNTGYSLLAAILESRTGVGYESYLRKKILEPADPVDISYSTAGRAPLACGFRDGLAWGATPDYFGQFGPSWYLVGNGALTSTIGDLDRWFQALFAGRVLDAEATKMVVERLTRRDSDGRPVFVVSGANEIFSSFYERRIDSGVILILLTSTDVWPKEKILPLLHDSMAKLAK